MSDEQLPLRAGAIRDIFYPIIFTNILINHPSNPIIMFCKSCGTLLVLEKNEFGRWMKCPNGHYQPELQQSSETISIRNKPTRRIEVMDGKNHLAVYDFKCKKCGYGKSELIEIMPCYSDEDNTFRMKCGKCGHVEQLEGKVK